MKTAISFWSVVQLTNSPGYKALKTSISHTCFSLMCLENLFLKFDAFLSVVIESAEPYKYTGQILFELIFPCI